LITTATNPAAGLTFAVRAAVCDKGRMDTIEYLDRIRDARVYDVADKTPLELAKNLSERLGNRFLMKREDLQPVFSFKLRGAYNKISACLLVQAARGL
jgi:threonine dehydratase